MTTYADQEVQKMEQDSISKSSVRVRNVNSLISTPYDYIAVAYPSADTETYTYKSGGASGTTVGTITVVYTDSTKANVSSVAKT